MKTLSGKTVWTPLWHIYQPPNQSQYWLEKVAEESYAKIIEIYEKHPSAKLVLNINGSLTELLLKHKLFSIIDGFKRLAEKGQLEFVSTLCYHAIAPLIPEEEVIRQIKLNDEINSKAFGKAYKPTGVWLPEMAYSRKVIKPIVSLGYTWISLPGVASNGGWTSTGIKTVADDEGNALKVLFRDDRISLNIAFGQLNGSFTEELRKQKGTFCFTTMDGETIGHHQPILAEHLQHWLSEIEQAKDLQTMTASELIKHYPAEGEVLALPSSWSTTYDDIVNGNFYPLWLEQNVQPFKSAHQFAWDHLYNVLEAASIVQDKESEAYKEARALIDKCMFSCSYWWFTREASHRASPRYLANLDMQAKALRMLIAIENSEKLHSIAEKNEHIRSNIYELLNNYQYAEQEMNAAVA